MQFKTEDGKEIKINVTTPDIDIENGTIRIITSDGDEIIDLDEIHELRIAPTAYFSSFPDTSALATGIFHIAHSYHWLSHRDNALTRHLRVSAGPLFLGTLPLRGGMLEKRLYGVKVHLGQFL